MELLQYGTVEEPLNINEKVKVRYAPTVALAVPHQRTVKRFQRAAMVVDRNFTRDEPTLIEQGFQELQQQIPTLMRINKTMEAPSSIISGVIDQLFVWHESKDIGRNSLFSFAPFQFDHGTPGSSLDSWMQLPWRGIRSSDHDWIFVKLPKALADHAPTVEELFITSCGLMASGTRSILISRWRVGGQTTIDLTREFALLLNDHAASDALAAECSVAC